MRGAGVLAVLVVVALLIVFGPLHRGQDADSLLPVLVSLYGWQPFFWEQDRFGMLVPLLATGIHHPFHNLMVQTVLTSVGALGAFFALARLATERHWVTVGAAAATLFLVTESELWRFQLLSTFGPFALGLGISAAGAAVLVAAGRLNAGRLWFGTLLLVLGSWVNTTTAFLLLPALVLRAVLSPGGSGRAPANRTGVVVALAAASLFSSTWLSTTAPVRMKYTVLPPSAWPGCWAGLLHNAIGEDLLGARQIAALAILLAAGTATLVLRRGRGGGALAASVPLVGGALVLVGMMGTLNWTLSQGLAGRYSLNAIVALDVAVVSFAAVAILDAIPEPARRRVPLVALAGLVLVALVLYNPLSPRLARQDLDRVAGAHTEEVIDAGITHIAGSYWTVWPAVYHANLTLYERGSRRKIWGIAHRASPTADRWAAIPLADWRVAAIPEEFENPWTAKVMRGYGLPPLRPIGRLRTFTVLVPDTAVGR